MRIWIDLTNSPHVLVMRPLIAAMREDGHEVEVTARDFAQTLELCARFEIPHTAIGRHRGGRLAAKGVGLVSRSLALVRWARGRRFDVAMGHGSNDVSVAAALLGIPSATAFDYEWAKVQHQVNCRLARAVVVPDAIPPSACSPTERRARSAPTRASRRSTTWPGSSLTHAVFAELGLDAARPLVVVRTPPEVSLYHRFENPLFPRILEHLARQDAQAVVLPRTAAQREEIARLGDFVVPERAVDAQSLVALADLVVSAGGTMNREAVALGTPVYTTFEGRLGAVDEALLREGRLRRLGDPEQIEVQRRSREKRVADTPRPARTRHTASVRPPTMRELTSSVNARRLGQVGVDACLLAAAYYLAYVLRFDAEITNRYERLLWDTIARDRGHEARDLRHVRPLLEALALRRPEGLRGDPQGRGGVHGRPDRGAVPLLDRAGQPSAKRDRARLPALPGLRERRPLRGARAGRAPGARPLPRAGGQRGADRRRRKRRPAGGLRAAPQPGPAQRGGGLCRRRSAQAGHARGRPQGAGHHERPCAGARRRQARRGDHRHSLGARDRAPEGGYRLSRAGDTGAHAAHHLRAALGRAQPHAPGARGARGGRARPRAGAGGDRPRGRLPLRAGWCW